MMLSLFGGYENPTHNERHNVDYLIPVQLENGQILLLLVGYNRSGYEFDRPSIIEKCIRFAISKGWQFDKKLPALEMNYWSIMIGQARINTVLFVRDVEKDNQDVSQKITKDTRELIDVGEYQIALENTVSNICDYGIELNKNAITLAEQAFLIWSNNSYLSLVNSIKVKQ